MKIKEGNYSAKGLKFAIIVSRFNNFITDKLLAGAIDSLKRHEAKTEDIDIIWVPGAFEIPLVAKKVAKNKNLDGIICLGAVIKGDTPHFDFVASEVTKGVAQVSLDLELPIAYGVLTTDSLEQAIDRAGTKSGNKGAEAALTVIELCNLFKQLK
jgi:6,7-dimethyl-8-ribityllumazine synthase